MTPPLAAISPAGPLHRVARRPDAWAWPDWVSAGADGTYGNRYDDPRAEYRVVYACSRREGAYVEVLARYRVDPALVAEYAEIDAGDDEFPTIPPGVVPADWPATRSVGVAHYDGSFADVGHSDSLAHLRGALAARLVHHGLDDLDGGEVRMRVPRAFTQEISRYVFEHGGTPAGIRYLSRLGDDYENWAIFEDTAPLDASSEPVEADDPDLVAALSKLGLHLGT